MPPKDVQTALERLQGRASERAWVFPTAGKAFYVDSLPDHPRQVVFSKEQATRLKGAVVAHNHLSETFLSLDDVVTAVRRDISANWVTTPRGTRFGFLLDAGHGVTEEAITDLYDRAVLAAYEGGTETTDYESRLAEAFRQLLDEELAGRARLEYNLKG